MGKYLAYLQVLVLYLLLVAGCRVQRAATDPLASEPCVDSVTVATPGHPARRVPAAKAIRLGKKSTVNYYLAPAYNVQKKATLTVGDNNKVATGTNKGNLALADSTAQIVDQAKAKQAAANTGAGSRSDQLNTAPDDPPWYSYLLGPPGYVLAGVVVLLLLVFWARRRAANAV